MQDRVKSFMTLSGPAGPFLLRAKKSKFTGLAFPAASVQAAEGKLLSLREAYPDATHICYAYRIGVENPQTRASDDGEPAYAAGSPILGQITSAGLFDVLVCVVRYYGGTKLGAGGLTQAYREAARGVLEAAPAVCRRAVCFLRLQFDYPDLDEVMGFVSQNRLKIRGQEMGLDCGLELVVPPDKCDAVLQRLKGIKGIRIQVKEGYL